jgi:hypothetical protein
MHTRRSIFVKLYKTAQRLLLKLYRIWHWTVRQSATGSLSGYMESYTSWQYSLKDCPRTTLMRL